MLSPLRCCSSFLSVILSGANDPRIALAFLAVIPQESASSLLLLLPLLLSFCLSSRRDLHPSRPTKAVISTEAESPPYWPLPLLLPLPLLSLLPFYPSFRSAAKEPASSFAVALASEIGPDFSPDIKNHYPTGL
jgi:hypothetical protein